MRSKRFVGGKKLVRQSRVRVLLFLFFFSPVRASRHKLHHDDHISLCLG